MEDILRKVKQHLDPACSLLVQYLGLLGREAGLGGIVVWFGDEEKRPGWPLDPSELRGDELTRLAYQTRLVPADGRRFCALIRKAEQWKGSFRCNASDRKGFARAARTKRTQVYQCHAGLTEIVVPILIRNRYIGHIITGQLVHTQRLSKGFDDVWERIRDLAGLDREESEEAFRDLGVVNEHQLRYIVKILEDTAVTLGKLWDAIVICFEQEKQVQRMRFYQERDFAEWLIGGERYSEHEAMARAQTLGFTQLPCMLLVAQLNLADKASFEMSHAERQHAFGQLVEVIHGVSKQLPVSVFASIRPEELVMLWSPPKSRNPQLGSLRIKELVQSIREKARRETSLSVLIGVSSGRLPPERIHEAYYEIRNALRSPVALLDAVRDLDDAKGGSEEMYGHLLEIDSQLTQALNDLRHAVVCLDRSGVNAAFEKTLRVITQCPDHNPGAMQLFCAKVVEGFFRAFDDAGVDFEKFRSVKANYIRDFARLSSQEEILEWFSANLGGIGARVAEMRRSPDENALARACSMVLERLDSPLNRSELATRLGMSESNFGKLFHAKLGMAFREYVLVARMSRAQNLLLVPHKSVLEVALDVGYSDTSAFTRAFTKTCGVSPTEYRDAPRRVKPLILPTAVSHMPTERHIQMVPFERQRSDSDAKPSTPA